MTTAAAHNNSLSVPKITQLSEKSNQDKKRDMVRKGKGGKKERREEEVTECRIDSLGGTFCFPLRRKMSPITTLPPKGRGEEYATHAIRC